MEYKIVKIEKDIHLIAKGKAAFLGMYVQDYIGWLVKNHKVDVDWEKLNEGKEDDE